MRAVFLDFGTVSHDDLDTRSLERVLPGIQLYPTSTDAEVDERIAGCDFILTNKLRMTRARMRAVPGLRFVGLTATVFLTGSNFSWMQQALRMAGFAALGLIVASLIFGFTLGLLFSAAMVVLASGYILYYTSNVMHRYPIGSHVAAALALFSAVALLFWYVFRILMDRRR